MAKLLTLDGKQPKAINNVSEASAENLKIVNLADPTNDQDAATKVYVDTIATSASEALDGTFRIKNTADNTKQLAFDVSTVATATTRTIVMPNENVDLGLVSTAIQSTEKGAANGVAPLNASSKIDSTYLPALAITEVFTVADITARDALTIGTGDGEVQEGDVAIVTDASADPAVDAGGASYIYNGSGWERLLNPTDAVQSVNGQTGIVTLDSDDISEGSTNLYYTSTRFDTDFAGKSTTDLSEGTNLYFTEARVLATVLTGLSTASNDSVSASDSVLQAIGKLQARTKKDNLEATTDPTANEDSGDGYEVGSMWYNQTTDTLFIAEDVTAAAAVWQSISGAVDSVNSQTGAVVLDTDDIDEGGSNLYFTDARARTAVITQTINDGTTDRSPSEDAVFDALALKADATDVTQLQAETGLAFNDGLAGEAFAANEIYFVRRAKNGETAGSYYKAQADSFANARVVGFIVVGGTAVSATDSIRVYKLGEGNLGSGDSTFAGTAINEPVYLDQSTAGKFTLTPAETTGSIIKPIGYVAETGVIEFQPDAAIQA